MLTHHKDVARLLGDPHYQGAPCAAGHDGTRHAGSGACVQCERENRNQPERKATAQAWRSSEEFKARRRARTAAKPEAKRQERLRAKARREGDPAFIAAREAREAKAAATEARRQLAKEQKRAARLAVLEADREAAQARRLHRDRAKQKRRRALMRGARGDAGQRVLDALSFLQSGCCAYCGDPIEHLDHKEPIALGGRHIASNLQWLCAFHNMNKRVTHDSDYRATHGIPRLTPWDAASRLLLEALAP